MIGISRLYCQTAGENDELRYGTSEDRSVHQRPVVVWNCTRRCNLRCRHCYAGASEGSASDEMNTDQARRLIDDLGQFGVPVLLFSGGEPSLRDDVFELAERARQLGMRTVFSTNGTTIDTATAERLAEVGANYIGVSLDGARETHDAFRGVDGAFDEALEGIENCRDAGLKVGLRFTITQGNAEDVPDMFRLVRDRDIQRLCFYHLVYAGRGGKLMQEDLSNQHSRRVVDDIIDRTARLYTSGREPEVLTVDNHADGPYLYLRMQREGRSKAEDVKELLVANGGNASGRGIACINWNGEVYPDQFWRHATVGDVTERCFPKIWTDTTCSLLQRLRNRREWLHGRCAKCRFLDMCNGNSRVRAEAATDDRWAPDPACYLTDEEIGIA